MLHKHRVKSQGVYNKTGTKYDPLKIDGVFGSKTIMLTQQLLGTKQNGIISNQPTFIEQRIDDNAIDPAVWEFICPSYKKTAGSPMVCMLQKLLGITEDGYFTSTTIFAMQKFLSEKGFKCSFSGRLDIPTVEAWQHYLNYKYGKEELQ